VATAETKPEFDDVMLAMDVVDTLRHRELVLAKEFNTEDKKSALITRLREIYSAQGIDVPDSILEDGVKALEEQRFTYPAVKPSFGRSLAMAYINRGRWGRPLIAVLSLATLASAMWHFGFDAPREARAEKAAIELSEQLPRALSAERDAALSLAGDDAARARINFAYDSGAAALRNGDAAGARSVISDIAFLKGVLGEDLLIRVVSRPGEYSGVFRIPEDRPDARNYYLIVEAVDGAGKARQLEIASEEDQKTQRATMWGVRVPEDVFNAVAADKADDEIIQNARIGQKPKGALAPTYSIATAGGAILEW
jgi:hypothetical protein